MAVNKSALIRYQFLDACFRNFERKFYFEEILELLNDLLSKEDVESGGVKVRQLRDDIRFMKSDEGYGAPIIAHKEGRKAYYRYENSKFSIVQSPLNKDEKDQLEATFLLLQRFNGALGFEWVQEIGPMLQNQFNLHGSGHAVMSIDQKNQNARFSYVQTLLNAIVDKQVLKISYAPSKEKQHNIIFHPYFLKQHSNQWFVFGRNESNFDNKYSIPLSQIDQISGSDTHFLQTKMDWQDYFHDVIGVKQSGDPVQQIQLKVDASQESLMKANPIHSSQKMVLNGDGSLNVSLKVKPNQELESKILAYGEFVEIIFPVTLKHRIHGRIKKMLAD
jgi:predicted DNA-binding transcriptional regulator YafY